MLKIATLSGGYSTEASVSVLNAGYISQALKRLGHQVTELSYDGKLLERLSALRPDAVFLCVQGKGHGDGTCQGLLEYLQIPYTGSKREAATVINNKIICQRLFAQEGLPVPANFLWSCKDQLRSDSRSLFLHKLSKAGFSFPCVAKAPSQGGSFGIVLMESIEQLPQIDGPLEYDSTLLVEEYIPGAFYTVGLLADENCGVQALPVMEGVSLKECQKLITFDGNYTVRQADIPAKLAAELQEMALRVFETVGAKGYGRVDFMLSKKDGKPRILEINAVPGLKPQSLYPPSALLAGIAYDEMIDRILRNSLQGE